MIVKKNPYTKASLPGSFSDFVSTYNMGSFFTDKFQLRGEDSGGPRRRREGPAVSSNLTARVRLELDVVGSCADGRRPRVTRKTDVSEKCSIERLAATFVPISL